MLLWVYRVFLIAIKNRNSRPEVFCEKGVLSNFTKSIGKHLCQSLFLNKVVVKKETLAQVFSCEFWDISKYNFPYRLPLVVVFEKKCTFTVTRSSLLKRTDPKHFPYALCIEKKVMIKKVKKRYPTYLPYFLSM